MKPDLSLVSDCRSKITAMQGESSASGMRGREAMVWGGGQLGLLWRTWGDEQYLKRYEFFNAFEKYVAVSRYYLNRTNELLWKQTGEWQEIVQGEVACFILTQDWFPAQHMVPWAPAGVISEQCQVWPKPSHTPNKIRSMLPHFIVMKKY